MKGMLVRYLLYVPCLLLRCGEIYFTALNFSCSAYVDDSGFVSL